MAELTKQTEKVGIEIGSIFTVIFIYLSMVKAGVFSGIDGYTILQYTVSQFILLILIFIAAGSVFGMLLSGLGLKYVYRQIRNALGKEGGYTEAEIDRMEESAISYLKSRSPAVTALVNFTVPEYEYPEPDDLRNLIAERLTAFGSKSVLTVQASELGAEERGYRLSVDAAVDEDGSHFLSEDEVRKKLFWSVIVIVIVSLISLLLVSLGGN